MRAFTEGVQGIIISIIPYTAISYEKKKIFKNILNSNRFMKKP